MRRSPSRRAIGPLWPLVALVVVAGWPVPSSSPSAARSGADDHGRAARPLGHAQRRGRRARPAARSARARPARASGGESFAKEAREDAARIAGREGGEGERVRIRSRPWGEQVANRAYPAQLRRRPPRARGPPRVRARALAAGAVELPQRRRAPQRRSRPRPRPTGRCSARVTPNVSGEASQFWDPVTGDGRRRRSPAGSPRSRSTPRARPATAGCGPPPRAAASGAPTTRWPTSVAWIAPPADLPTNVLRLDLLRRAARHRLRRLRASRTARATPRPGSACSARPTSATPGRSCPAARRCAIEPRDRLDRRRPDRPEHDLHRHGARAPRLLVGQRRPAHPARRAARSASTGPPTAARPSRSMEDLSGQDAAEPDRPAPDTGTDWFAGRGQRLEFDPNDPDSALRGGASATASGAPRSRAATRPGSRSSTR